MASPSEILIIHPDDKVRSTLSFLLEDQGFKVRAGDRVPPRTSTPPILAIVALPVGDSLQTASDVRHTYPEPKLIVLVKDPTVPQLLGLFSLLVARCFQEPVKVEAILQAIRELIPDAAGEPDVIIPASPPPQGMGGSPATAEPYPPAQTSTPFSHFTTVPFGRTSAPMGVPVSPMGRSVTGATNPGRRPGLQEEDRYMDSLDRKLADYRGFRGPVGITAPDKSSAEKAGRKLAKLVTPRDPVMVEPVSLGSVRKHLAEARPDTVYVVRSAEVIPPPDREWIGQLLGQHDPEPPRLILAFGQNTPEWTRMLNLPMIRLAPDNFGGTVPPTS